MEILQEIGSYAGLAAVLGLAVLSALYFSQARDVKRLREWAGRAPERAPETTGVQRVPARPVLRLERVLVLVLAPAHKHSALVRAHHPIPTPPPIPAALPLPLQPAFGVPLLVRKTASGRRQWCANSVWFEGCVRFYVDPR